MTDVPIDLLLGLLVATGIGFLIGLEREFHKKVRDVGDAPNSEPEKQFAGLRTFTLIALLGFLSALLAENVGAWFLGVAFLGFVALVIASYTLSAPKGELGATSEITAIITFLLGALAFQGFLLLAIVTAVLVLVLLSFKLPLHRFVKTMSEQEIRAIIQFAVITALVLPFLPNEGYGPYAIWNPMEIWSMVILVAGISLVGYLLSKILGGNKGTLLAGVLGGLASSTAVALSFSRKAKVGQAPVAALAAGIIAASTIMFPRILLEVFVVNPSLGLRIWLPIAVIMASGLMVAYIMIRRSKDEQVGEPALSNPLNFKMALQFAVLYAAVRWLMTFAQDRFGDAGYYVAGLLSGTTDVDAITLGMARVALDPAMTQQAIITILLAALSNTMVKFIIVLAVGGKVLGKAVAPGFGVMFAGIAGSIAWVALG